MQKHILFVALALFLSACGPSAEQNALKVSLVTLSAAISQGVNVDKFSELTLDLRTKFELAKSSLSPPARAAVESAVISTEATKSLWETATFTRDRCVMGCVDTVRSDLLQIGLIKNPSEYNKYMRDKGALDPSDFSFEYVFKDGIIQSALGVAANKLESAEQRI